MAEYLLGIDNGNTVSKVAIFDLDGREVQTASRKADVKYPAPGCAERDMNALWNDTAQAIREVIDKAGIRPEEIIGIGPTGHGNGLYLLDKHNQPLRPAILSVDTRADDIIQRWHREGVPGKLWPMSLQAVWPGQPNTLLRWIKEREPDNYNRIGWVLLVKDFIKYKLTGEINTDYVDMSGGSLLDVAHRHYTPELLEYCDISEVWNALPPLVEGSAIAGRVTTEASEATGLVVGTPVVSGMMDVAAGCVGSGGITPGQACIIAGSWSINSIITAAPMTDPNVFMVTDFMPDLWVTIEGSPTSASNLEWFVTHFCAEEAAQAEARGISVYEICNERVAEVGSTDVIFQPFLFGSNVSGSARAGFYGLGGWHTRAHVVRAVYEGIVYSHLTHVEKLRAAGANPEVARLSGGGARSRVWTQIFADALAIPMEIPSGGEISALGMAICAGVGVGAYKDHAEGVARAVKIERRQEPNPDMQPYYRRRFDEYTHIARVMEESWLRWNTLET